jgi:hypothetical protein
MESRINYVLFYEKKNSKKHWRNIFKITLNFLPRPVLPHITVPTVSMARLPVVPLSLLKCFLVYPLSVWWYCLLCPLSIRLPAVPSVYTAVLPVPPCYVWLGCLMCPLSVRQVFSVESLSCNLAFRAARRERELPLYLAQLSCIFSPLLSIFSFSSFCVIRSLSFTCPFVCLFSALIFLYTFTERGLGHLYFHFFGPGL